MTAVKTKRTRSSPRVKIGPFQIAYLNFVSGNSGIVLDVSTGGFGFQAVEPLAVDQLLPVRLSVPGSRQLNLSSHVAWLDDSRKRGGLRITAPPGERREYQLWQKQCIGSRMDHRHPGWNQLNAGISSQMQPDAKESRTTRNVLAGCLILVLYFAAIGGWHLLASSQTMRSLLAHFTRSSTGVSLQASTLALPQDSGAQAQSAPRSNASPTSDARASHRRRTKAYDAQLSSPDVAPTRTDKPESNTKPSGATPNVSPPSASTAAALQLTAQNSSPGVHRAVHDARQDADSPSPRSALSPAPPDLKITRQPQALAISTGSPERPSANPPGSRRGIANPPENSASGLRPASSKVAYAPLDVGHVPEVQKPTTAELAANFQPCQLLSSIQPAYPKGARKHKVEGDVKLRVVVGTDGTVRNVSPVSGPQPLVAAAIGATRQFHYKPAILNGQPIETIQTIDISFKLER